MIRSETLGTAAAAAYRGTFATVDAAPASGAAMPPGWEGLLFPFDAALADLRPDGTPARDGVLPEVDLPRRMYAGEDTVFHAPLRYGDVVEQIARAGAVAEKQGRSGRLVFADLVREYRTGGRLAIESTWHDVFLESTAPRAVVAPPGGGADWTEDAVLDERQLFRFSALTFNTHRVHYDRDWAVGVEQLDDLLVHGPLTRILLLDAARRHGAQDVAAYEFRATAPVFVNRPFRIEGRGSEVVAVDDARGLLARGVVTPR